MDTLTVQPLKISQGCSESSEGREKETVPGRGYSLGVPIRSIDPEIIFIGGNITSGRRHKHGENMKHV